MAKRGDQLVGTSSTITEINESADFTAHHARKKQQSKEKISHTFLLV